jgi:hypothetical protein
VKRKFAILGVFILCVSLFLTGGKPKLISEDEAKQAGLAFINQVFDVNETEAVVSYQEQTGATFIDGDYKVTGEEQPVYVYVIAAAKQEDGEYLYYAHVNAETGVAYAAFRNTMFAPELTSAEKKALQEAREQGISTDSVYLRITTECQMAAQKWIPEKFDLEAGILGFLDGGGSLESNGGNANFYVVVRDGTIYHVTFSWPQLTVIDVTLLNQTRPTEELP